MELIVGGIVLLILLVIAYHIGAYAGASEGESYRSLLKKVLVAAGFTEEWRYADSRIYFQDGKDGPVYELPDATFVVIGRLKELQPEPLTTEP